MLRASRCTTAAARFARVAPLRRALCSAPSPPTYAEKMDDNMNLPPRFEEVLRGVGQVIFLNSPAAGTAVLAALTYGDPWLGTMAALGTISATASAHARPASSGRRRYQPHAHATASGMDEVDGTRSLRKHRLRSLGADGGRYSAKSLVSENDSGTCRGSIRLLRFASRPQPQIRFALSAIADVRVRRPSRRIGRLGIGAQR